MLYKYPNPLIFSLLLLFWLTACSSSSEDNLDFVDANGVIISGPLQIEVDFSVSDSASLALVAEFSSTPTNISWSVSTPDQGIASVANATGSNNTVHYTANPSATGVDSFVVTVEETNSGVTNSITVNVVISVCAIIEDGLVIHLDSANSNSYPGTGDTWFDLTTNGHDFTFGEFPGADDADPSFVNEAFELDGNDFFTKIGSNGDFVNSIHQPGAKFTIELWTLPASGGSFYIAMGTSNNGGITGFRWFLEGALGGFHVGPNVVWYSPYDSLIPMRDQWQMTAISVDTTTTTKSGFTYLNGVASDTFLIDDSTASTSPAANLLRLAAQTNNTAARWPAGSKYAIVRMYDRALSANELAQNWCAHRGRFGL